MARGEGIPRSEWPTRRREWARRLREWSASGLSQAAYCRREGLDKCTFSGWKRRLRWKAGLVTPQSEAARGHGGKRNETSAPERAPVFVPLRVAGRGCCTASQRLEVVLRNGRVVRCESSVRPAVLATLAAALEDAIGEVDIRLPVVDVQHALILGGCILFLTALFEQTYKSVACLQVARIGLHSLPHHCLFGIRRLCWLRSYNLVSVGAFRGAAFREPHGFPVTIL